MPRPKPASRQLAVCVDSADYPASLQRRKTYVTLRDVAAEKHGLLRVVNGSGETILIQNRCFRMMAWPQSVKKAVLAA